jgi:hypothetical protein
LFELILQNETYHGLDDRLDPWANARITLDFYVNLLILDEAIIQFIISTKKPVDPFQSGDLSTGFEKYYNVFLS